MNNNSKIYRLHSGVCLLFILLLFSCSSTEEAVIEDADGLSKAIKAAKPGDVITMKNGVWRDIEIVFDAKGTVEDSIVLKAETPGKVFIEGQSNLGISGEFLKVEGLVFRNGYTATSDVIAFRTGKNKLANHSRVTDCVIDNFSNPERYESDIWVTIFGKNNRFDHNTLVGKMNRGVTLAIRLNTEESRENNHVIEKNYFGPRQNLASNGGETLRIGTSHYSLTNSNSVVRHNYFEECDGELEIISNKSGGNQYLGNVFYKSKGTLTMRHGKNTLVEDNYFLGNRKINTGGIRVINEYQTVKNNYLFGLTGHRFRGALVVMNGVPNSPINRYNQVVDATIEGNILINCDHVQLCAGSDEERSAIPTGSSMRNNVFINTTNDHQFTVYDDISGIAFNNNVVSENSNTPSQEGFTKMAYATVNNEAGLVVPGKDILHSANSNAHYVLPVQKAATGASYYPKKGLGGDFNQGTTYPVEPGTNTLHAIAAKSAPGDVLLLENGGSYLLTKTLVLTHPLTIRTPEGEKATLLSEKSTFFKIENHGGLALENVIIDGKSSPDQPGNNVVSTSKYSMNRNYRLKVEDCIVQNLDVNHSFHFLKVYPSTMADTVSITGSTFENITGSVLSMATETEDLGMYNVEYVLIHNSKFRNIGGSVAHIYRGGRDESTFGPNVAIHNSQFNSIGKDKRNKTKAALRFLGVQNLSIRDCNLVDSAPIDLQLTNGEPINTIENLKLVDTEDILSNGTYSAKNITTEKTK